MAPRNRIHDTRPKLEQANVDKTIAACIAKIGEDAFLEAYEESTMMSLNKVVSLALEES